MFIILLCVVAGALALILVLAALKPDSFRVERQAGVAAPAAAVFALINDFQRWPLWSPWEKLDPAMRRTFDGPAAGVGAVYSWSGNNKVGAGRMEIAESLPPSRIVIDIDFFRPTRTSHKVEFLLAAKGSSTVVTWAMYGRSAYAAKIFSVFCSMDQMVGKDFEAGLATLKAVAEAAPAAAVNPA